MFYAKNYGTASTLLKLFRENYWLLFFRTRCKCEVYKGLTFIPVNCATYNIAAQVNSWFPSRRRSKSEAHRLTNRDVLAWFTFHEEDLSGRTLVPNASFVHLTTRYTVISMMVVRSIRLFRIAILMPVAAMECSSVQISIQTDASSQKCSLCKVECSCNYGVLRPVHTDAEKCDCCRKVRLSHFSATVWTGLYTMPATEDIVFLGSFTGQ